MPPYKSFLLLVLILAVCAVSCKPAEPPPVTPKVKNGDITVDSNINRGVDRIYDAKYNVVCYQYYGTGMSCVKL